MVVQSMAVTPPEQGVGERIDKFITRFEFAATAYDWDDRKQAKLFPAVVREEKILAQINNLSLEAKASFNKMKSKLVDFPRAEVMRWIHKYQFKPEGIDTAIAELSKMVEMAYERKTKDEIK